MASGGSVEQPVTRIGYGSFEEFPGWDDAPALLRDIIRAEHPASILEVGSGANPTLTPDDLRDLGVDRYTTNDASADELRKAPSGFDTLCADLDDPNWKPERPFDLIFSRMVNEHIEDGQAYFSNLFEALEPNGLTVHCFSTLYTLPFVANRYLPEALSSRALDRFAPRDHHQHEKFRAYYSWSRGPTAASVRRFESLGFVVEDYLGYFGHSYYNKIGPLQWLEGAKTRLLMRHPVPQLTSYALVKLRRPA